MDASTRPSSKRRQDCARFLSLLTVLSFSVAQSALPAISATAAVEPATPEIVSSIAQDASHEVAIRNVGEGNESLSLTARLSTLSNTLAEDISWEIRTPAGELLMRDDVTELTTKVAPGEFIIEAKYGAVSLREHLTLLKGHALNVNFVLNAGGLRVLPVISDVPEAALPSHTLVYAMAGPNKGKLVTHSRTPGEILKLAAGQYRIENRYGDGNAIAIADVRVKPGKMSAVEVKHQAGVARLSFVGDSTATVDWNITQEGGSSIAKPSGLNHALALRPGTYIAEAHVNGETLSARFKISAGQQRDIMLGN